MVRQLESGTPTTGWGGLVVERNRLRWGPSEAVPHWPRGVLERGGFLKARKGGRGGCLHLLRGVSLETAGNPLASVSMLVDIAPPAVVGMLRMEFSPAAQHS